VQDAAPAAAAARPLRSIAPDAPAPNPGLSPAAAPTAHPTTLSTAIPAAVQPGSSNAGPAAPISVNAERWLELVAGSGLRGPARELAAHSGFLAFADGVVKMLADALALQLGAAPQIRFELAQAPAGETLHARSERQRDARQAAAEEAFMNDPNVQRLVQAGARVVPDSIRPFDD
jgi:DNA polymerase-3 subunit gamma/tau